VSYREASRYRPPPRAHQRITRVMGYLAATGLSPRRVVVLEVLGRLSGRPRRTVVVLAEYAGHDYVISLGGESEWVRNVRARGGDATVLHGRRRSVRLMDVPPQERAPILKAYARRRAASRSPAYIAREYFGVRPDAPPSDFAAIADRYPVFRVTPRQPMLARECELLRIRADGRGSNTARAQDLAGLGPWRPGSASSCSCLATHSPWSPTSSRCPVALADRTGHVLSRLLASMKGLR
jgi:deazaflavin-dependent oxidoreductase (nitroreductase family)